MEESTLIHHNKITLKNMAVERGLTNHGFNGRNRSNMRKRDLVEFILAAERLSEAESIVERLIEEETEEEFETLREEDMIAFLDELLVDNSFSLERMRIMDAIYSLEHGIGIASIASTIKDEDMETVERIPNEEDETVPNLVLKDLVDSKNMCNNSINCNCQICQQNNNIIIENLKIQTNIKDLEARITCVICHCNVRNILFNPCNHLASCITCSKNPLLDKKCPLCRKVYTHTTRVFY